MLVLISFHTLKLFYKQYFYLLYLIFNIKHKRSQEENVNACITVPISQIIIALHFAVRFPLTHIKQLFFLRRGDETVSVNVTFELCIPGLTTSECGQCADC